MHALTLTLVFAAFVAASLLTKLWLDSRQIRRVATGLILPRRLPTNLAGTAPACRRLHPRHKLRFGLISKAPSERPC